MSEWKLKRFWTGVTTEAGADGVRVLLDGRPVRTPGKAPLLLPTEALAHAVAAEWAAQEAAVDFASMPLTRYANTAIDRVTPQFDEVAAHIAGYGGTDLLCYRAGTPEGLAAEQARGWDPLLDWAREALGAPLVPTAGVIPVAQPAESLARLGRIVRGFPVFELTALHDLVSIPGSLILGLAVAAGRLDPEACWHLSRIDEEWQIAEWGRDDEAQAAAEARRRDLGTAAAFLRLVRDTGPSPS